ncbi:MAG: ATP-binding protein [Candidatus Brocadiaceae bacterium]
MTEKELQEYIQLHFPKENERCEWKAFGNLTHDVSGRKGEDVISYVSAIANMRGGHLVIGVEDTTLNITGIQNFHDYTPENLPARIAGNCTHLITEGLYVEDFTTTDTNKKVWIFHIPKHAPRKPVIAHKQPWQRLGDNLVRLTPEREDAILSEPLSNIEDWSAVIVPHATIDDLDKAAIAKARENYKNKFPEQEKNVDQWDNITFLNKAKVTIKGKVTRAAIILLGKPESEHFISPAEAKIRWLLKDAKGQDKDYHIESSPFLLAVDKIYAKVRNLKCRYIKDGTLFPDEVDRYEPFVIREAINNCIAHQDYTKGGRINVIEMEDQLIFTNLGSFIPGSVEKVVKEDAPEEHYRNRFLATAMFNLKMVDTAGGGIRKMFNFQKDRFFPLPEYELSEKRVKVTITGKVLDIDYARVLAQNKELSLDEIIMLDKVQKKKKLTPIEVKHLRDKKLIEGRKPNYYISAKVAQETGQKAAYTKNRPFDKAYYLDFIEKAIKEHGHVERSDVDELLWNKLPEWMNDKQKKTKINNLLSELRRKNRVRNAGSDKKPKWVLITT